MNRKGSRDGNLLHTIGGKYIYFLNSYPKIIYFPSAMDTNVNK
jgi:hypothetical protein